MKSKPSPRLEQGRITTGPLLSDASMGNNGVFKFALNGELMQAIVSDELGWDHVSVTAFGRCPTWDEMCATKRLFFRDDETVIQYHPPKHCYVNTHPHCLHLWRKHDTEFPLPPMDLVG